MKPTISPHHDRQLARARQYARELLTPAEYATREAEIAALPTVEWKGQHLRALACQGIVQRTGQPCVRNEPEAKLWALIALTSYRCEWHR
jgi:hypothetical protein